jgi:hypothetical protein
MARSSPPPAVPKRTPKIIDLPTRPVIKGKSIKDYLLMVYGPPGVGKTTWFNEMTNHRTLFLSTDRGTKHLKSMAIPCHKWYDFEDAIASLKAMDHLSKYYDFVCVDHVEDMAQMAEETTLTELKVDSLSDKKLGWGVGWKSLKRKIFGLKNDLLDLGLGLGFIAHEDIKTIRAGGIERDQMMPGIGKSTYKLLIPIMDYVGYAHIKSIKKGGERQEIRAIQFEPSVGVYAKDRTRRDKSEKGWERLDGKQFRESFTIQE